MLFKKRKFNAEVASKIADKAYTKQLIKEQKELETYYKNILVAIKNEAKHGEKYLSLKYLPDFIRQRLKELGFSVEEREWQLGYWKVRW